ncbi:MAG: HAD family phosphatase [Muribaculaceae bacterium]|nr:HAD family phosphatase [Muribaculaceae bacterium]
MDNKKLTPILLFDLGGVIMSIDRMKAVEAFKSLGMADADSFFDPYEQRGAFGLLEAGRITTAQFHDEVRPQFRPGVSDDEIDEGLCKFLLGIPSERLERLAELRRKGYKVYMLSNTNPIMWDRYIIPEFRKLGGELSDYFDGVVTSFEAGVCKPDARIYGYAVKKLGIDPAKTTFFDDGPGNVEAARALGFNALHVTAADDMLKLTSDA